MMVIDTNENEYEMDMDAMSKEPEHNINVTNRLSA